MYSRADFYVYNRYSSREEKEEKNMEYLTGVKPKETKEISELLEQAEAGTKVKVNGAVHTIRDMGTVAFVILRKREGLLQCVYEEGSADFELKDIKEAATVEVEGVLEENEKAPNGIEIRMESVKILSEPEDEMMPLAISKWKLNTSLEAKLNYRSISLRNIRERAKFRIQEGKALIKDICHRIELIQELSAQVPQFEVKRVEVIRQKLQEKINEWTDIQNIDENRLEQEIIYYLEKLDITEEKVRLANHCKYFLETIEHEDAPGRKIGFIAQEIGREINTMGSKANDHDIQKLVVKMKDELEKIKEQSLNVL